MKGEYIKLSALCKAKDVELIAVSKRQSIQKILELYNLGQRDFGENRVQELLEKKDQLPADIRWHLIGPLQRNKVKYIVDFIWTIQSVNSEKLLKEINSRAQSAQRVIPVLLQPLVAQEDSKSGFLPSDINSEKCHTLEGTVFIHFIQGHNGHCYQFT